LSETALLGTLPGTVLSQKVLPQTVSPQSDHLSACLPCSVCEDGSMELTSGLSGTRRAHVEGRLRATQIAWLTTVRPDGRPDSVPVWFLLRDDETILVYSEPAKAKLRNISLNPRVALGLDETNLGRDVIRIDAAAEHVPGFPAADQVPEFLAKYAERISASFGTAARFAGLYTEAIIITPHRLHA
jgi:PPOX class probable F420-dependent enzyme